MVLVVERCDDSAGGARIRQPLSLAAADASFVEVSLEGHQVARACIPIQAEAATAHAPVVVSVVARVEEPIALEPFSIDAEIKVWAKLAAVADGAEAAFFGAAAAGKQAALRILGALGDDVDDAVYSVL